MHLYAFVYINALGSSCAAHNFTNGNFAIACFPLAGLSHHGLLCHTPSCNDSVFYVQLRKWLLHRKVSASHLFLLAGHHHPQWDFIICFCPDGHYMRLVACLPCHAFVCVHGFLNGHHRQQHAPRHLQGRSWMQSHFLGSRSLLLAKLIAEEKRS